MSRKAKLITLEEFKTKVQTKLFDEDGQFNPYDNLTPKIESDLKKIVFDWENYEYSNGAGFYSDTSNKLCGFQELKNGLPVLFVNAGGDWEIPIIFIIYWSGKEFRAYIPEDGNVFDKKFKTAYGSQQESSLYEKLYIHLEYEKQPDIEEGSDEKPDFDKIENDIINRIEIIK